MSWSEISHGEIKARKLHRCVWCYEMIEPGEKYMRQVGTFDGDLQSNAYHLECDQAAVAFDRENPGELGDGFTGGFPRGCYCDGDCDKCKSRKMLGTVKEQTNGGNQNDNTATVSG